MTTLRLKPHIFFIFRNADNVSCCGSCLMKLQGGSEPGQALVVKRVVPTSLLEPDSTLPTTSLLADKVLCQVCSEKTMPHLQGILQLPTKKGLKRKRE